MKQVNIIFLKATCLQVLPFDGAMAHIANRIFNLIFSHYIAELLFAIIWMEQASSVEGVATVKLNDRLFSLHNTCWLVKCYIYTSKSLQ